MTPVKMVAFDLETTSQDVKTAQIVEFGAVTVHYDVEGFSDFDVYSRRFSARGGIPAEASAVHGITDADVEGLPHFTEVAHVVVDVFAGAHYVVTYNGTDYDIPLLLAQLGKCPPPQVPYHIDVFGLHRSSSDFIPEVEMRLAREAFSNSLTGALAFWANLPLVGAHGAVADCQATLEVLRQMLRRSRDTLAHLAGLSVGPPPGFADRAGKFRIVDGEPVCSFGKHKNTPLSKMPRGYLQWMLGQDFPNDTKAVVRAAL